MGHADAGTAPPALRRRGVLWIPCFRRRRSDAFRPREQTFETFEIPTVGDGEYETPYALNVDRSPAMSGWRPTIPIGCCGSRRRPEDFPSYPSPTRVTVLRDFAFTRRWPGVLKSRRTFRLVRYRGSAAIVHLYRAGGRSTRSPRAWTQGAAAPAWGRTLKSTCLHDGVAAA